MDKVVGCKKDCMSSLENASERRILWCSFMSDGRKEELDLRLISVNYNRSKKVVVVIEAV